MTTGHTRTRRSTTGSTTPAALPDTPRHVVPDTLDIVECTFYAEMDTDDSLRVVLRPSGTGSQN